ncbi:MAG: hypothetical protein WC007_13195 [Pelobacteraceae bacterium]
MSQADSKTASDTKSILDAIPAYVFAVDDDVRIIEYNNAAATLLDGNRIIINTRAGEAIHCIHSHEVPEGCGHAPACQNCVIRNSVAAACKGEHISRKRTKIEIRTDGASTELFVVITASPFVHNGEKLVLLLIEDISELLAIQEIVPICMKCKKVQSVDEFWVALETYFKNNWGIDFSHGYCPECGENQRKLFNDYLDARKQP